MIKRCGVLYYSIGIIIAAMIHSSMLFYLIFILCKVKKNYEIKYLIIIAFFALTVLFAKDYVIKISSLFINEERINRYFYSSDMIGIKGGIAYSVIIIAFYYISKLMLKSSKNVKLDNDNINFYEFNLKINILMTIAFIFSIYDPNFFRLQRISWILLYISIVKLLDNNIKSIEKFNINIIIIGMVMAILGNLIMISINTPEIITSFLL